MPSRMKMTWLLSSAVCMSLVGGAVMNASADEAKNVAAAPAAAPAAAAAPFAVYPADIALETSRDYQNIVVQVTRPDGVTNDVTAEAKITLSDPKLAKVEGSTIRPLADGTGEVVINYGGHSTKLPLTVKQAQADRPTSFRLDVMPV